MTSVLVLNILKDEVTIKWVKCDLKTAGGENDIRSSFLYILIWDAEKINLKAEAKTKTSMTNVILEVWI